MTDEILRRSYALTEMRSRRDERIIEGRCVPYDLVSTVADPGGRPYREKFVRGAFRDQLSAADKLRVELRYEHAADTDLMGKLGKALVLEERDDGLHGVFRAFDDRVGEHALAMVDDGHLTGLSIAFKPKHRTVDDDGVVVRDRCHLAEVSLVGEPAYAGAVITARRSVQDLEPVVDDEQIERLRAVGIVV